MLALGSKMFILREFQTVNMIYRHQTSYKIWYAYLSYFELLFTISGFYSTHLNLAKCLSDRIAF